MSANEESKNVESGLTEEEREARGRELKEWADTQTEVNGDKDPDFLTLFLLSEHFDVSVARKAWTDYYVKRTKYPQWWTKRSCEDPSVLPFIHTSVSTVLKEVPGQPTVSITHMARFGADSSHFDAVVKTLTIGMDVAARRRSTRDHAFFSVLDFEGCPWWLIMKLMWPSNTTGLVDATMLNFPLRYKKLVLVNASTWASTLVGMITPLLPASASEKIHCCGTWAEMPEAVPLELLPEEYGGSAGPLKDHEEAFIEETMAYNQQLMADNQYDTPTEDTPSEGEHTEDTPT